ncbi:OmpA family protein [Dyella sp. 2RAB6]|uniref:OmpA family protein n=1 Tax=Dyella sp. 2RAB6 TaxID=3232992 RepID=UPI003F929BCE
MTISFKSFALLLGVVGIAGALSACGNLSRGIARDGRSAEALAWPAPGDATPMHKDGSFPLAANLQQLGAGLGKQQVSALIGYPHFSEGVWGVREWNYVFHFRDTGSVTTCQFKILFDQDQRARSFYWKPEACVRYQQLAAVPAASTERFILSADALFAFDRDSIADMTNDGRAQLDALAGNLLAQKQRVANIRIAGYTDRLGSDAHNDQLSGRRAYAVKDYLVGRGLPAEWFQAEGLGAADPVRDCDEAQREALIECLAPNRRVVVQVSLSDVAIAERNR